MNNTQLSLETLLSQEDSIQNQIDDIIFNLIRERKKRKITQTQLSEITGIPQATISRVESFNSIPTLQILLKISNAFGYTLELK